MVPNYAVVVEPGHDGKRLFYASQENEVARRLGLAGRMRNNVRSEGPTLFGQAVSSPVTLRTNASEVAATPATVLFGLFAEGGVGS